MESLPFTPLIIIGAGRSGTNVLRDVLTALPKFATWSCDEINPIWRHGNLNWPNDEFTADLATPSVRRFIRRQFCKIWRQTGQPNFVVEKTCANALRVEFVDAVLPEAKYIHIVRNGADVIRSAEKRWRGELELPGLPYFLAKIRYAPKVDLPRYGFSFVKNRLALKGREKRFSSWGPRFAGVDSLKSTSLSTVCALQWAACVKRADDGFLNMPKEKVFELQYEDFVADPEQSLKQICRFLGVEFSSAKTKQATDIVRKNNKALTPTPTALADIMAPAQQRHGYGD